MSGRMRNPPLYCLLAFGLLPAILLDIGCGGGGGSTSVAAPTAPTSTALALSGTVRESPSNTALADVFVQIADGPNAGVSAVSGASGAYTFSGLRPAGFTARFTKSGYDSASQAVMLTQNTTLDVALTRTPSTSSSPSPTPSPAPAPTPTPSPSPSPLPTPAPAPSPSPLPSAWPGTLPPRTSGSHQVCQATLPDNTSCINNAFGPPQAICTDKAYSCSTGSGTCSSHGGVYCWRN